MARPPEDEPLERTLSRAADGDEDAWQVLVERYTSRVYAVLLRHCKDRELAEELTQATFVKVVESLRRYEEKGQFEPWLFRIALNQLRDEMRRRGRQARPVTERVGSDETDSGEALWEMVGGVEESAPLENLTREERAEQVRAAIERLSEADQTVLHLRHTAGLSFPQIAETLGEPVGTVLARGHRCLKKLRRMLEQDLETQEDTQRP